MTREVGNKNNRDAVLAGIILLLVGTAIIVKQTIEDFPAWVVSWPMILVVIGIFVGMKNAFRGPGWIILIGLGCIFLADKIVPGVNLRRFALPAVIISIGLFLIFTKSSQRSRLYKDLGGDSDGDDSDHTSYSRNASANDENEILDSVSIFGSTKKVIFSKSFKGGEVVNIFGGAEINCSQADLKGVAKLEIVQVFGGTKIFVPASWTVKSNAASVFGGFEDKRTHHAGPPDPEKVLIIDGTSIFGGIEIKSF
ncbi:MAG: hypothetical protein KIT80_05060 [Chitinophagaceae bacterium]|nr:hypothetical protein [Chitinophagaceae bacterium]MCW5926263.1 hypothetical protein [Chitinophagaceae bacterium]